MPKRIGIAGVHRSLRVISQKLKPLLKAGYMFPSSANEIRPRRRRRQLVALYQSPPVRVVLQRPLPCPYRRHLAHRSNLNRAVPVEDERDNGSMTSHPSQINLRAMNPQPQKGHPAVTRRPLKEPRVLQIEFDLMQNLRQGAPQQHPMTSLGTGLRSPSPKSSS